MSVRSPIHPRNSSRLLPRESEQRENRSPWDSYVSSFGIASFLSVLHPKQLFLSLSPDTLFRFPQPLSYSYPRLFFPYIQGFQNTQLNTSSRRGKLSLLGIYLFNPQSVIPFFFVSPSWYGWIRYQLLSEWMRMPILNVVVLPHESRVRGGAGELRESELCLANEPSLLLLRVRCRFRSLHKDSCAMSIFGSFSTAWYRSFALICSFELL